MPTIEEQIRSADQVICQNIDSLTDQRALLSQNVLAQLRNLVRYSKPPYWGSSRAQLNIAGNFATRRMR